MKKLTRSTTRIVLSGLSLVVLLLMFTNLTATAGSIFFGGFITNPDQGNPVNIETCNGASTVRTTFQFSEDGDATINLSLPVGLSYVASSVMTVSSNAALTVTEVSADPSNPQFSVTGVVNGNLIQISYEVEANCAAPAQSTDIGVALTVNTTSNGVVTVDVLTADLSITSHNAVVDDYGAIVTVPISVTNGGLGSIEPWTFYIVENGGITQSLTVSGTATVIPPANTNGDTVFYTIDAAVLTAAGLGPELDNAQTIDFDRELELRSCLNQFTDIYGARFGCPGACQDPEPTAPGTFNVNLDAPDVEITATTVQRASYCQSYIYEVTFTNQGSTIAALDNIRNLEARVFFSLNGNFIDNWDVTEVDLVGMELVLPGGGTFPFAFTGGDDAVADFDLDELVTTDPDPDGPGGLADLDGDGAYDDLPAGESVTLRLEAEYISEDCTSKGIGRLITFFRYDNECTAGLGTNNLAVGDLYRNNLNFGGESFTQLALDGDPINHELNFSGGTARSFFECYEPRNESNPSNTNPLTIIYELPDGVVWNGDNIIYRFPQTTTLSATGDSIIATNVPSYDPLGEPRQLAAGFVADCSLLPPGTGREVVEIPYTVIQTCETGCLPNMEKILCDTLEVTIICDGDPCLDPSCVNTPGLAPPTFQRTTLGYDDRVAKTRFTDPALIPTENLKRGTICDTLQMQSYLSYCGTGSVDNVYLELGYDLYGGTTRAFQPTVFNYYLEKADGSIFTGTLPAPTETDFNGQHRITYDFTSILPGGVFEGGDSLAFTFDYYVMPSADGAIGNLLTTVPDLNATVFSLASPTDDPLPGGAARSSCGSFPLDFSLHDVTTAATLGNQNRLIGCQSRTVRRELRSRGGANVDYYPDEVRPMNTVDSITIEYGNYYDPTLAGPSLQIRSASPGFNETFPLTDTLSVSADGRTVTYDTRSLPLADFNSTNNLQGEYLLFVNLQSNCNSGGDIQSLFHYRKYAQTGAPACDTLTENRGIEVEFFPPSGTLSNTTGPKIGDEEVECYLYRYENSIRTTNNVILYSEEDGSVLELVRVRDLTNNTEPAILDYSGGHYVELATSIAPNVDIDLEICVTASDCPVSDMLNIVVAYECTGFMNPDSLVTECRLDEAPLEMQPREAAIQVDYLTQPSNPVTLCEPLVYDVRVNSSQVASVLDPMTTVIVPPGMEIATVEIEYPINSTNFESITPPATTGSVLIDLGAHTMINDSLPGTGPADVVTYPGGEDRQALLRLTFLTSCDFTSGERINIIPEGINPCGGQARGSGDLAFSNSVEIDGAEVPYSADVAIDIGADSIITCEPQNINFNFTFFDGDPNDGQPSNITSVADSIEIFLPAGTEIVAGSFNCDAGINCPGIARVDELNNLVILSYPVSGVEVPDQGSLVVGINFDIQTTGGEVACNTTNQFGARAINFIAGVSCVGEPGDVCGNELRTIVDQVDTIMSVRRAQIVDLMVDAMATTVDQYTYSGSFMVTEENVPAGDNIVVEVYCSDGASGPTGTLLGTTTVAGPLSIGDMPTFSGMVSGACSNQLYFVIAPDTEAGEPQCVCVPEAATVMATEPVCSLTDAMLAAVTCNDAGTNADPADDFVSFTLNPTVVNPGAANAYNVTVSSGSVSPTSGTYGAATTFQLQAGSAGGDDVTITLTDADNPACTIMVLVTDPGSCSPCIPPTATLTPTASTCTGGTENNDGTLTLTSVSDATTYAISSPNATTYDGPMTEAAGTSVPAAGTDLLTGITHAGANYVVRFYNGTDDCFLDVPVRVPAGNTCVEPCAQPDLTLALTDPTCSTTTPNNDAQINLTSITNADRVGIIAGADYTGGPDYASADDLGGATDFDLMDLMPATEYTVRVFNGSDACYRDYTLTTKPGCCELPLAICPALGESVTLTADAGLTNYQWFVDDNMLATATTPTYEATAAGSYTWTAEDATGCVVEACCPVVILEACANYSLGSTVFEDLNNNGLQDAEDAGIGGVIIELYDNTGTLIDVGPDGVLGSADDNMGLPYRTDPNGNYLFTGLPASEYQVGIPVTAFSGGEPLENIPYSSIPTETTDNETDGDDNGSQTGGGTEILSPLISLGEADGEPTGDAEGFQGGLADDGADDRGDMTVDFGLFAPVSLGDTTFVDLDENGLQDAGEPPLPGVTVTLYDAAGNLVTMDLAGNTIVPVQTDANGFYEFTNLPPGDYYVIFDLATAPGNDFYTFTTNTGGDEANDSDADPTTGQTDNTGAIASGERVPDLDAGVVCNVMAEAGTGQTICSTASVDLTSLGASITPDNVPDFGGTWTTSGNGTFDDGAGRFGVATSYTPGPDDIAAGQVILTLTTDDPSMAPFNATACGPVMDEVTIQILKVDCGSFPWGGN